MRVTVRASWFATQTDPSPVVMLIGARPVWIGSPMIWFVFVSICVTASPDMPKLTTQITPGVTAKLSGPRSTLIVATVSPLSGSIRETASLSFGAPRSPEPMMLTHRVPSLKAMSLSNWTPAGIGSPAIWLVCGSIGTTELPEITQINPSPIAMLEGLLNGIASAIRLLLGVGVWNFGSVAVGCGAGGKALGAGVVAE